ncbi:HAD hydrolase-like protein [Pseudogulbenkiania ferrooxidans]|uniref:HAD-superfamily hydrolase, subfamily IA, variant 1 n=1 Tax=Pseudogulbenkiania ferrooxidans 2002 TaxID=279714 RepID=B9Z5U0_9NEIS|nr:HAD hydrolase-like protein [Pseudogulbenkiania ferrooxidans]EEG07937.1 HAD-superfamily hydrolase, subfamily IA, variant 1 [Pseudogulbenkiania ferrooxidans 2002]
MTYRLAIFDFDGTLVDSFPVFTGMLNQLADLHGFKKIEPHDIPLFRHYSARQIMSHVGLPNWKLPLVARSGIALMRRQADAIVLFDGVEESLRYLAQQGVTLSLITGNSADNVRRILGAERLSLFRHVECGMSIFGKRSRIKKVLARAAVAGNEAIYIGDQITDGEAAHRAGVAFGAVAWGYGSIESLRHCAPEEEFESVAAIRRIA